MGTFNQITRIGDQLYDILPERWRSQDHSYITIDPLGFAEQLPFHKRFLRVFGNTLEDIVAPIRNSMTWYDPLLAPEYILPYVSQNVGWPLDTSLTEIQKRLLVRHVSSLVYRGKHKLENIQTALRSVTGLHTIVCVGYNNLSTQAICDVSLADECTCGITDGYRLSRADSTEEGYYCDGQAMVAYGDYNDVSAEDRELEFTFAVRTPILTPQQVRIITFICEYMKSSREHYVLEVL